jgi:hypothetical protein
MTNQMVFFLLFGVLCAAAGIFGYRVNNLLVAYLEIKRQRKVYPYVVDAVDEQLCKGPHKWDQITLALGQYTGPYTVCTECGYVSSEKNRMLNAPGLEVYKNNLKRRADREARWAAAYRTKNEMTHQLMNELIRSHVSLLGTDMQSNIEVMQQFFRKSNIELDSLYSRLNKSLDEDEKRG